MDQCAGGREGNPRAMDLRLRFWGTALKGSPEPLCSHLRAGHFVLGAKVRVKITLINPRGSG